MEFYKSKTSGLFIKDNMPPRILLPYEFEATIEYKDSLKESIVTVYKTEDLNGNFLYIGRSEEDAKEAFYKRYSDFDLLSVQHFITSSKMTYAEFVKLTSNLNNNDEVG